jgi:hypothetical protein
MRINRFTDNLKSLFHSDRFFIATLLLVAIQGLWTAMNYRPGLFDEKFHFDFIDAYSKTLNPSISFQAENLDSLGSISTNTSWAFYYVFGWLDRLIDVFINTEFQEVLILRLVFLTIFIAGLFFYRKLLLKVHSSKALANISILIFVLLPSVAPISSIITYDIAIFLIFPIFTLSLLSSIESKQPNFVKIFETACLGLLAVIIKLAAIAFVLPGALVLLIVMFKRYKLSFFPKMRSSFRRSSEKYKYFLLVSFVILLGIFFWKKAENYIIYNDLSPSCEKVLSEERCSKNYTYTRNIKFLESKKEFIPLDPFEYATSTWLLSASRTLASPLPNNYTVFFAKIVTYLLIIVGATALLIGLRELLNNLQIKIILGIIIFYSFALFYSNYTSYLNLGQPVAISSRYLIPVLPLLIFLTGLAFSTIFNKHKNGLVVFAFIICASFILQGGGVGTYVTGIQGYEWRNNTFIFQNNIRIKNILNEIYIR